MTTIVDMPFMNAPPLVSSRMLQLLAFGSELGSLLIRGFRTLLSHDLRHAVPVCPVIAERSVAIGGALLGCDPEVALDAWVGSRDV